MKNYTRPNVKITAFDIEDIITASAAGGTIVNGAIVNGPALTGEDADMYKAYTNGSGIDNSNVSIFTW